MLNLSLGLPLSVLSFVLSVDLLEASLDILGWFYLILSSRSFSQIFALKMYWVMIAVPTSANPLNMIAVVRELSVKTLAGRNNT